MFNKITEGKAEFFAPKDKKVSKDLPVFYNPIMEYNRTISIALLNALGMKDMQIAFPLAGTGIRGIRFLKELRKDAIKQIYFNDYDKKAISLIKKNLKLNSIKSKFSINNKDANFFLLEGKGFDYIDIDPFGCPNKFLDSSIRKLSREGIFAVTATDTSALCGTYPKTCLRKYWAKPKRDYMMHETGLRILIRKVQLIGAQYEKALIPIFSYSRDHYMRVFFRCSKGKLKVDELIKYHDFLDDVGPMWVGSLYDLDLVNLMYKNAKMDFDKEFIGIIKDEAKIDVVGFHDLHFLCKKLKMQLPKRDLIFKEVKKRKYKISKTHFSEKGIKSDIPEKELLVIMGKLRVLIFNSLHLYN